MRIENNQTLIKRSILKNTQNLTQRECIRLVLSVKDTFTALLIIVNTKQKEMCIIKNLNYC